MKVLIADHDAASRRLLEAFLVEWEYQVTAVSDGQEAWEILQGAEAPRLAVLDWTMPQMGGVEVCRRVRRRFHEPYTYMLLLASSDRKNDIAEGLKAGADGCLFKPFDPEELRVRLRTGQRLLALMESVSSVREAFRCPIIVDPLTGMWSRTAALDALQREIARAFRGRIPLAVILADLDGFQRVNDSYGYPVGDAVLRKAARRLRSSVRAYDILGRYEGAQFLAVLPDCRPCDAKQIAERLHRAVGAPFVDVAEDSVHVTLSQGVAAAQADGMPNLSVLVHAAQSALERAKRAGKNRIEIAATSEFSPLAFPDLSPRARETR